MMILTHLFYNSRERQISVHHDRKLMYKSYLLCHVFYHVCESIFFHYKWWKILPNYYIDIPMEIKFELQWTGIDSGNEKQ